MCGIFATQGGAEIARYVLNLMHHRGPDDRQYITAAGLTVGFNRLAVVDLASPAAVQPYVSAKARIIAFNGEIYNYRELDPNAKSEVALIGALLDERLDPRRFLDGDYAILSHDPSNYQVTLYRDRFGVCPLYYQLRPWVEVSSERRRLVAREVHEVPAGARVRIDLKKRRAKTDVLSAPLAACTRPLPTKALADIVVAAVRSRAAHSQVGYSVTASGGLDSSLVLMAAREAARPRSAIVAYYSPNSEDLEYARLLCGYLKIELIEVSIPDQLEATSLSIRDHFDVPHASLTAMQWRGGLRTFFAASVSPTKVLLCGDGPDELLGGYPSHFARSRADAPYRVAAKCLSTLHSMQHFNLDRTNKMGMAWSKEYRPPLLAPLVSDALLSAPRAPGKPAIRELLRYFGAPREIYERATKYSPDELAIEKVPA